MNKIKLISTANTLAETAFQGEAVVHFLCKAFHTKDSFPGLKLGLVV